MVTIRNYVRTLLLAALVTMAAGGFLLHLRIHPFTSNTSFLINFVAGLLSIVVVPLLFCWRKTIHYGYVLNGFIVIVATITMAHFSFAHPPEELNPGNILLMTTFPDILIVWGKFFTGKVLFDLEVMGYNADLEKKGMTFRYPNLGWWLIHFLAVAAVYYAGHALWR
ncbi:MAG: hypothetical protein KA801_13185 [Syntrophorhabdaceae bacterium]|nr:hypothetical protein [Syntrophorhabdaceae bacterium]